MKILTWIHTILFFAWMWTMLFVSFFLLLPLGILRLLRAQKAAKGFVLGVTRFWGWQHMLTSGAHITVRGKEHIPENGAFCVVGNHQGSMDIPILLSAIPRTLGFIAKTELRKIPFVSSWMKAIGCVFIDRKNLRAAIDALKAAALQVENGQCMVLFPEGTRSRSGEPGKFNTAGIRLLADKQLTVLPVTLKNSRALFEKEGLITPAKVELIIHSPRRYAPGEGNRASQELREIIVAPLKD